jgi:hypothetical protein
VLTSADQPRVAKGSRERFGLFTKLAFSESRIDVSRGPHARPGQIDVVAIARDARGEAALVCLSTLRFARFGQLMRVDRLVLAIIALTLAAGLFGARPAQAFPQWQFSSGAARCDQCHFAPAGGGLLTGYGQDADGEELSTFGGDGAFLHGALSLPSWAQLGGDFRGAFVAEDVQDPGGPKIAAFPMQAQLAARLSLGDFFAYGSVADRGQLRPNDNIIPQQNYQPITASWLISPEHYVMWRPSPVGPYVRVGRFFAPFGMRFAEHTLYVRRDTGFNLMQESYNVSGGYVTDDFELHVTAFAPDFLRHMGSTESGVAAYFERRILGDTGSVAVQARYASGPGAARTIVGAIGKYWVGPIRTMVLAEGDLIHREAGTAGGSDGFVGAAGFALLPVKGLMATLLGERTQTDLSAGDTATNAATGLFSWFPYAHVEVQLVGQLAFPSGLPAAKTFLAQVHYFL